MITVSTKMSYQEHLFEVREKSGRMKVVKRDHPALVENYCSFFFFHSIYPIIGSFMATTTG